MNLLTDEADFNAYFPATLNECTLDQLLAIQKLRSMPLTLAEFAVEFMKLCMTEEQHDELVELMSAEALAEKAVHAAVMFLESDKLLDQQKITELYLKSGEKEAILYGPESLLANISFGQFVEADMQYLLYYKSKNESHLNQLIAILYRPKEEKVYDNAINSIIQLHIRKTEPNLKFLINAFYQGCRAHLARRFKKVYPEKKEENPKPLKFSDIQRMTAAYHAKMVQYAKSPERKKLIYDENVYTVLEFIEHDILEYEEWENWKRQNAKN